MGMVTRTQTIWQCDRCAVTIESTSLPRPRAYRAWARVKWEQDAAFDAGGSSWANRVPSKEWTLIFCDTCADEVFATIEGGPTRKQ